MSTIDLTPLQKYGPDNQIAIYDGETDFRALDNAGFTFYTPTTVTTWEPKVFGFGPRRRVRIDFTGLVIPTVDGTTNGAGGGVKIFDFPRGVIQVQAVSSLQNYTSIVGAGGIGASAVLDIGVGTVVADATQETLATTKQNIVNKVDVTLSSGSGSGGIFQASATALTGQTTGGSLQSAFLNVACTAATSSADGTVTLSGFIEVEAVISTDY